MDTAADVRAAIGVLRVLYVRDALKNTFEVVCDPSVPITDEEMFNADKALSSLEGVQEVRRNAQDGNVIEVQFADGATAGQKFALYNALTPQFIFGKAWCTIVRDNNGNHHETVFRLTVYMDDARAVEKFGEIEEVDQFVTEEEHTNKWWSTSFNFTLKQSPTRDPALNYSRLLAIAKKLGVAVEDQHFTVKDNPVYAAMRSCNHMDDPIDRQ